MLAKAKLASSITFIVLASFTIVTYNRQNMFIIQATKRNQNMTSLRGQASGDKMTSIGGRLPAPTCHSTKFVNKAE